MLFTSLENLLLNLDEPYHRFKRPNSGKYGMAKRKNKKANTAKGKQKSGSGLWVVIVVALIAVVGLWYASQDVQPTPVITVQEPVVTKPVPQVDPARLAAMKGCQENYDYTFELCNRRTHQASVDNCMANAEQLLADCLGKI